MAFVRIDTGTTGTPPYRSIRATCTATVVAKDVVQLDDAASGNSKFVSVKQAAQVALGSTFAAGVAMEAGVAGQVIEVAVWGVVTGVNVETDMTNGIVGVAGVSTAGRIKANVAANTAPLFAISTSAVTNNTATVFLLDCLGLGSHQS